MSLDCWTNRNVGSTSVYSSGGLRLVIPKRGEKDFEPKPGGGSGLQVHVLDAARTAMFEALRAKRTISRSVASLLWLPELLIDRF